MPIIKSARKKLRQDRKREKQNDKFRDLLKTSLNAARKTPTQKNVSLAFKSIDKLTRKHILHKNKAARLKSSLSKKLTRKTPRGKTKK